jgi:thiaminase/transcriptional activator TenA
MALTNFFYWMLVYGTHPEKIAAVSASEDIFIQICARIGPALVRHYGLTPAQVEFFTFHDRIEEAVAPVDRSLLTVYQGEEDRRKITRAVRLSHEFELMFYDTIMSQAV